MRPYLAVIQDSFREALASRVLWILLLLITFFLMGLAPLGVYRSLSSRLQWTDILDPVALGRRLHDEFGSDKPTPGKRIFSRLDRESQKELTSLVSGDKESDFEGRPGFRLYRLLGQLNEQLSDREFYDPEAWQDVFLSEEAEELIKRDVQRLNEAEVRRRNRLLLEAAYPGLIAVSPPTSVQFHYAGMDLGPPLPIREESFSSLVRAVLVGFMDFFVGVVAVFVAILVTAPIIPHMFERGSVELLLSKPISRVLLFLAKFVGGCAFILVNAAYLICGFWVIAGWRFGVWESRLLLCIPIFLFLFMIYYSVSALSGLIWRSAIVCVVVTILFWALCFCVGSAKSLIESIFVTPERIVRIVAAGEAVISVNESNHVQMWKADARAWDEIFARSRGGPMLSAPIQLPGRRMLGPVYDAHGQQLMAVALPWNTGTGTRAGANLEVGRPDDQWSRKPVAEVPGGTVGLFCDAAGNVVAVARDGIFELPADDIKVSERKEDDALFEDLPAFRPLVRRRDLTTWTPRAAAMNAGNEALAVVGSDHVTLFSRNDEGGFELLVDKDLETRDRPPLLALGSQALVLADVDGQLSILDAQTLQPRDTFQPEGQNAPRFVRTSADGRWFAIVFHTGNLWLYDGDNQRLVLAPIAKQGDISAADFDPSGKLLVADRTTRVSAYDLENFQLDRRIEPKMQLLESIYRYAILPLYTVFPRPGELGNTIHYLLTDQETSDVSMGSEDLTSYQVKIDPWSPVISSLIFTIVVLFFSCWYIHRAEF